MALSSMLLTVVIESVNIYIIYYKRTTYNFCVPIDLMRLCWWLDFILSPRSALFEGRKTSRLMG